MSQDYPDPFLQRLKAIFSFAVTVLLGIAALAFVSWWMLPDDWRIKYAAEYMLNNDQVTIEPKPHDCEWGSAPLGNKHCHYEKLVTVYNFDGRVIDGTGIEVDASGTEISYDHRKTWQPRPADQKPAKANVVWQRIDD